MKIHNRAEMEAFIERNPHLVVPGHRKDHRYAYERRGENIKLRKAEMARVSWFKQLLLDRSAYALLHDPEYNLAVVRLAMVPEHWIADPTRWKRRNQIAKAQFRSLLQHLILQYRAPEFLEQGWTRGQEWPWRWHLHLARGGSVKDLPGLPYTLNKKMAHAVGNVPASMSIHLGFRWAQVMGLGGNQMIFEAMAGNQLCREMDHEDFWLETAAWLIRQKVGAYSQVSPVMDYLCRFRNDPAFSFKGRTWKSVYRGMQEWHRELHARQQALRTSSIWGSREEKYEPVRRILKGAGNKKKMGFVEGLVTEPGRLKDFPGCMITITQILTHRELQQEGAALSHCVASYDLKCRHGLTSIWSLRAWDGKFDERLLTIELNNDSRKIVQVRGRNNRFATKKEMAIVEEWARQEKLKIQSYL